MEEHTIFTKRSPHFTVFDIYDQNVYFHDDYYRDEAELDCQFQPYVDWCENNTENYIMAYHYRDVTDKMKHVVSDDRKKIVRLCRITLYSVDEALLFKMTFHGFYNVQ